MRAWILALALLSILVSRFSPAAIIVTDQAPESSPVPPENVDPLIGNLTPDDIARGLWDLKQNGDLVVTQEQQAALAEGLRLRRNIEELRAKREELRQALREDVAGGWSP